MIAKMAASAIIEDVGGRCGAGTVRVRVKTTVSGLVCRVVVRVSVWRIICRLTRSVSTKKVSCRVGESIRVVSCWVGCRNRVSVSCASVIQSGQCRWSCCNRISQEQPAIVPVATNRVRKRVRRCDERRGFMFGAVFWGCRYRLGCLAWGFGFLRRNAVA